MKIGIGKTKMTVASLLKNAFTSMLTFQMAANPPIFVLANQLGLLLRMPLSRRLQQPSQETQSPTATPPSNSRDSPRARHAITGPLMANATIRKWTANTCTNTRLLASLTNLATMSPTRKTSIGLGWVEMVWRLNILRRHQLKLSMPRNMAGVLLKEG